MNIAVPMTGGRFAGCLSDAVRVVIYRLDHASQRVCTIHVMNVSEVEGVGLKRTLVAHGVDRVIVSHGGCEVCDALEGDGIELLETNMEGYPEQIITQFMYHPDYFGAGGVGMTC